jgi:hypothetical protein
MDNLMRVSKNNEYDKEWETGLSDDDKVKMLAKLDMLEDLAVYIDCLREGYTRTLKINNVGDDGDLPVVPIEKFITTEGKTVKVLDDNYRIIDNSESDGTNSS